MCRRCPHRHCPQPLQPLPYLAVWTGDHARQERTGEEELRQPDQFRSGPRLHHPVELRHRRDVDTPCSQCQGRCQRSPRTEREGDGEGRPQLRADLPATGAVLGQPARHERPRVCGCLRDDALRPGPLHREGSDEMGVARRHHPEHPALMGKELHALHQFLPRLCADVRQVPNGSVHPRHCRVHHPLVGDDGTEEGGGRT